MKANEIEDGKVLMIGDLVIGCIETDIVGEATYKIPCKVTDINHYGDVICEPLKSFPDELDWQEEYDFSWIEAIPLTAEILEKNGWRNVVFDDETPVMQIETRCDAFWWDSINGECGCERSVCDDNGEECIEKTFFCKGICYVHELQRALRLCGIDKTIEIL